MALTNVTPVAEVPPTRTVAPETKFVPFKVIVVPPAVDVNGYGIRVPGLMISPYAPVGAIDSQTLSFDAYLKLIEDRFLEGSRLDPNTDGRPDPRPTVRENVIEHHQAILRVKKKTVAWKQVRIQMLHDSRNVERLVANTISVAAGIQIGDEAEGCRTAQKAEPFAGHC